MEIITKKCPMYDEQIPAGWDFQTGTTITGTRDTETQEYL